MATNIPERIILWILEDESIDPKYFRKVDVRSVAMLEVLRFTLESNDLLE